jgi:hypothetical protein
LRKEGREYLSLLDCVLDIESEGEGERRDVAIIYDCLTVVFTVLLQITQLE